MSERISNTSLAREPIQFTRRGRAVVRTAIAFTALASVGAVYASYQYQHPKIACEGTIQMSLEPTEGEDNVVAAMVTRNPQLSGLDLYQLRETVKDANPALKDPAYIPQVGETFKVPVNCKTHIEVF
jgi:hypothetical protein